MKNKKKTSERKRNIKNQWIIRPGKKQHTNRKEKRNGASGQSTKSGKRLNQTATR